MTDKNNSSSPKTKRLRENLFGKNGNDAQAAARKIALSELNNCGASGSRRKWWAFEGSTEVDCYLETDKLVLLIEGKRTEPLSSATMWYPKRNQVIRNLEVAREIAFVKGKEYGILLIAEDPIPFDLEKNAIEGLPHLDKKEVNEISSHYLGCVTWRDVCHKTGIPFSEVPDMTEEVARQLLQESQ